MERAVVDRAVDAYPEPWVMGGLIFAVASDEDDADLRSFLRSSTMPGWIELGYERESGYFRATDIEGDRCDVVVVREQHNGRLAGFFSRSVREIYFNGKVARLGYLGQLRVQPEYRGHIRRLRHGYNYCNRLRKYGELPFDLTAIVEDNHAARRLLTRGLPGLPQYLPHTSLTTLVIPAGHSRLASGHPQITVRRANKGDLPAIVSHLNACYRALQFAPVWTAAMLNSANRCRGLEIDDFLVAFRDGVSTGCLGLWDQSRFKQVVVRGYRRMPPGIRPLLNPFLRVSGYPALPPVGQTLRQAFLSHWAVAPEDTGTAIALLDAARSLARQRKLKTVLLGLTGDHPLLRTIRKRYRHLAYSSRLYVVNWDPARQPSLDIDDRPSHVELATL